MRRSSTLRCRPAQQALTTEAQVLDLGEERVAQVVGDPLLGALSKVPLREGKHPRTNARATRPSDGLGQHRRQRLCEADVHRDADQLGVARLAAATSSEATTAPTASRR
jgi:hypothetical protein